MAGAAASAIAAASGAASVEITDGSVSGAFFLAAARVKREVKEFAEASRLVSAFKPNKTSRVAGIDAWSYIRWSIRFPGISDEMTSAGTRGPYFSKVKPFAL